MKFIWKIAIYGAILGLFIAAPHVVATIMLAGFVAIEMVNWDE